MDPEVRVPSCILITGANIGLGFECARQLALVEGVQKILLACRSQEKGTAAKERLEQLTNKEIFEVILMDVSSLASVKKAIETLKDEAIIDGVVLNAGGGRGGITCSGYPGRPPPSPPPSSCSSPWPPAGRLKHTKHAKLNSNLNNGKSFWQKYQQKKNKS